MNPDRYVGLPYDEDAFDCADLVMLVQREMFGREVSLPNGRPRGGRGQVALGTGVTQYAHRTNTPVDGDLVLMRDSRARRPAHVGVHFHLDHEAHVLHSNETNGCAVIHRARDLPGFGVTIEGYYAWA